MVLSRILIFLLFLLYLPDVSVAASDKSEISDNNYLTVLYYKKAYKHLRLDYLDIEFECSKNVCIVTQTYEIYAPYQTHSSFSFITESEKGTKVIYRSEEIELKFRSKNRLDKKDTKKAGALQVVSFKAELVTGYNKITLTSEINLLSKDKKEKFKLILWPLRKFKKRRYFEKRLAVRFIDDPGETTMLCVPDTLKFKKEKLKQALQFSAFLKEHTIPDAIVCYIES